MNIKKDIEYHNIMYSGCAIQNFLESENQQI